CLSDWSSDVCSSDLKHSFASTVLHEPPGSGLVTFRGTKLPGVAQYDLTGVQVNLPDVGEISSYLGELAGPTAEVNGVGDDRVEAGGHCCRGGGRLVKGERVSRFGDPVM